MLWVAEEDGVRIGSGEGVDDAPLRRSEVLDFVDLYPVVAREAGRVGEEEAMGFGEEVVEVEDAERGLISMISFFSLTKGWRCRGRNFRF